MKAFLAKIRTYLFPPEPVRQPINLGRATMTLTFRNEMGGITLFTRTVQGRYEGGHFEIYWTAKTRVEMILEKASGGFIKDDNGQFINLKYVDRVTVKYEDLMFQP